MGGSCYEPISGFSTQEHHRMPSLSEFQFLTLNFALGESAKFSNYMGKPRDDSVKTL